MASILLQEIELVTSGMCERVWVCVQTEEMAEIYWLSFVLYSEEVSSVTVGR